MHGERDVQLNEKGQEMTSMMMMMMMRIVHEEMNGWGNETQKTRQTIFKIMPMNNQKRNGQNRTGATEIQTDTMSIY